MAILSIQSHVVYGYAGNSAAVFPMQRLGHEVWAINTVEFSNHTGYGSWKGKILGGELADELVTGLEERGVLEKCSAVLSGYMGDAAVGKAIINAVTKVRTASKNAIYCCDPVMGDVGRGFYVKPDIPEIFKNELIPLADIITPNQFELEALTGQKIINMESACKAIDIIHKKGTGIVLLTSFNTEENNKAGNKIGMIASGSGGKYSIETPLLPLGPGMAGSGDITASVFLARYLETGDLKKSLELCTASIYGILKQSWEYNKELTGTLPELRIIQAQSELDEPGEIFKAVSL